MCVFFSLSIKVEDNIVKCSSFLRFQINEKGDCTKGKKIQIFFSI